jgi:hypothetical protein
MEVSEDKKCIRICLDVSPLFLHIFPSLVQALVVTYDETVQSLAADGDVLLPQPFPDLGFDGDVTRNRRPIFFFQFAIYVKVRRGQVWAGRLCPRSNKWLREQNVSIYRQSLKNLVVRHDNVRTNLGTRWKNKRLMSKHISVLCLTPLTSNHLKKTETYWLMCTNKPLQVICRVLTQKLGLLSLKVNEDCRPNHDYFNHMRWITKCRHKEE